MDGSPRSLGYFMIGGIANSWAMIEHAVDLMNAVIFTRHEAREYEDRVPLALDRKLKFLRRACARMAALAPYQTDVANAVSDALTLKEYRHVIIHGVATGFDASGITYDVLRNENDRILVGQVTFTLQEMHNLLSESLALATRFHSIEGRFRTDWVDDPDKPFRELSGG